MSLNFFELHYASYPLIAFAIHDGHEVRENLASRYNLSNHERLREEDPYTGIFAQISPCRMIGKRSRFETDLNRAPENAVYQKPEDAWGLNVWKESPTEEMVSESMSLYNDFYAHAHTLISRIIERFGFAIIYDIHSYNYKRESPDKEADPQKNPEINMGTENNNRDKWQPVIDRMMEVMRGGNYMGRSLDVRENVKFGGGYLSKWVNDNFGDKCLTLSIEFKKFFMDEWKGVGTDKEINTLKDILTTTIDPTLRAAAEVEKTYRTWETR
ncbi:MAG: N-formylglutamate amidohydrolase [Cyclobacteriaceae bacterium]